MELCSACKPHGECAWEAAGSVLPRMCPVPAKIDQGRYYSKTPVHCKPIDETFTQTKPRCVATVMVGQQAEELGQYTLPRMREYAELCDADFIVVQGNKYPGYPLANKFRLAKLPHQHCVYFDIDVLLTDRSPNLLDLDGVWMHRDAPYVVPEFFAGMQAEAEMIAGQQKQQPVDFACFSTGVVVFDDPSIWAAPQLPFATSHVAEQTWIEIQCKNRGIQINELPSDLNWQGWFPQFGDRELTASIIHLAGKSHEARLQWLARHEQELGRPSRSLEPCSI